VNKVIEIQLSEIRDIGWPVDETLVQSFRSTLQAGSDIPIILVNICYSEDGWYYEVIDGLHRLAAKQREGATSIYAQVVEVDDRTARLQRIQACMGKPAPVTAGRARVELCRVFRDDILQQMGAITVVYEPVLTEEGKRSKRIRQQPLPEDPIELLYVVGEHIALLEDDAYHSNHGFHVVHFDFNYFDRTQFQFGLPKSKEVSVPTFVGWEQIIRDWVKSITSVFPGGKNVMDDIIKDEAHKVYGHENVVNEIHVIPDVDIRRILMRRHFNKKNISDLVEELNWGEQLHHHQRQAVTRSEQIRLLTTMPVIEVIYKLQRDRKNYEAAEDEKEWGKAHAIQEARNQQRKAESQQGPSSTVVFAAASSQFLAPSPQLIEAVIPSEVPTSPELTLQGLVQRLCREHGYVLFAYNNGTTIDMVAGDIHRSPQLLQEITDHVKQATQGDQING